MPEDTLRVGSLVFTRIPTEEHKYTYEAGGLTGIKVQLNLGWMKGKAVAIVQYPKDCNRVEAVGDLPSVIETALNEMKQDLELDLLRAKRRLETFNVQRAEILIAARPIRETG
jgi:hypothetical protein